MPSAIANVSAPGSQPPGGGGSSASHVWYDMPDGQGNSTSFGFAPDDQDLGQPFPPGPADSDDNQPPSYSQPVDLPQDQFDAMQPPGADGGAGESMGDTAGAAASQDATAPADDSDSSDSDSDDSDSEGGSIESGSSGSAGGGPLHVCNGATLMCTFGMAPSTLVVLPTRMIFTENQPAANIMDFIPMVNIMPFGMCMSIANPEVASATAAAMGVLTPMPCIPVTVSPWVTGSITILDQNFPALNMSSTLMCMWAGVISIVEPGQMTVCIP